MRYLVKPQVSIMKHFTKFVICQSFLYSIHILHACIINKCHFSFSKEYDRLKLACDDEYTQFLLKIFNFIKEKRNN